MPQRVFLLQAFEAGKDNLPDWLLFDDTLATFSGVPMENDAGNIFIEVNALDNDQLILDEIFAIEVRPAGAVLFKRKLSKSFLQKLNQSGLSDGSLQQSSDHVSEQRGFGQPLHFLPSFCPSASIELIGNLLLKPTTQLSPTHWVKLFELLANSLGIQVNKLYTRNMMYESFSKKTLLWGHYVGSDSLTDAPGNKTFTLMSFLIGCSKDSAYSDVYRVIIRRINTLLESIIIGENSLLNVLERWFITLEGDDSTEAQKLHQRQKRQNAAELPDVQQQDFYVVHTTGVTDMITTTTVIIPTTVIHSVTTTLAITFSSELILTATTIPVVTILPSPMTSILLSADQTTLGVISSFVTVDSSLPSFITSPSLTDLFSTSLLVATSIPELSSTSFGVDITTMPASVPSSSLSFFMSDVSDSTIIPSATFTSFDSFSFSSTTEVSLIVTTMPDESTSVVLTLPLTSSLPALSSTSIPDLTSSVPFETSSLLFTDIDTSMPGPLTVSPTLISSFIAIPSSSEFSLFTQSDLIMTSPSSVFTDIITIPTITAVSSDEPTVISFSSFALTSMLPTIPSVMATPMLSTPLLNTTLVETPTSFTVVATLTSLVSTTVETTAVFTDLPSFSFVDTLTPIIITPSIISDDVSLFTMPSVISTSSLFMVTTPVPTSTLTSPTFNITSTMILVPSSEVVDMFTTEVPDITLSISETVVFSATETVTPSATIVDMTDVFTSFILPPTSQVPASTSLIDSFTSILPPTSQLPTSMSLIDDFTSVFVTIGTPSVVVDTSVSTTEIIPITTIPSFVISSIITSSIPSVIFTSVDDTTGIIVSLPVTPTVATAITSVVSSEIIFPITTSPFVDDTFSFTAPPVTSVIMNITVVSSVVTTTTAVMSSFSPSPEFTTTLPPSVPVTMISDVISTSEFATVAPSFTMLPSAIPTPSMISPSDLSMVTASASEQPDITTTIVLPLPSDFISTSEVVTMAPPSTMLPSIIPTASPTDVSVFTASEVTTQPDVSTTIVLPVTISDVISTSEVVTVTPSFTMPTSVILSPSVISPSDLSVVTDSEVFITMLPDVTTTRFISPSLISDVMDSSADLVPTLMTTVVIITPTPTNVSSISTMFPSVITATTSELVSPSPSFSDISFITPSVSSMIITPTTLTVVDTTDVIFSSQVLSPNVTSVIDLPSITITTDVIFSSQVLSPNVTSIIDVPSTTITTDVISTVINITSTTTQIDISRSISVLETSAFVPTTTLVAPTIVTPSTTILSFTSTVVTTPTPTETNQPPQLVNPILPLTWQEGQLTTYEIPDDTFYDNENGPTSNLSLTLQTLPGQLVSNTSWVQLINGVLYGLPLNKQIQNSSVTEYVFILTAQDSQGIGAHDFVVIIVEPQDPLVANFITFFVEGDFDLFNQQIIEKTRLINRLVSFGPANATDDVYIRDLFNGSIGIQYGNRTIENSDCTGFFSLLDSIFNNVTVMYSNSFATALLPFNVIKMAQVEGPCYNANITPAVIPPDLGASDTEGPSSTKFLATVIPGIVVTLILLLVALFACILYRRTHPGHKQTTFVRRNPIVLEVERQNRPHRAHRPVVMPEEGEAKYMQPEKMTIPPKDKKQLPPYRLPLVYENYIATNRLSESRLSLNPSYQPAQHY